MINLLPPEEKNRLLLEKKKKIAIIFGVLVLFILFCIISMLVLFNAFIKNKINLEEKALSATATKIKYLKIQNIRKRVKSSNLNFKKLNSFYRQKIYFSDILKDISKITPKEIFLTNISISYPTKKQKNSKIDISLSGFCPNRETLFDFKKNFQKNKQFRDVYFSPSDWVKPSDINFFVTFKIK